MSIGATGCVVAFTPRRFTSGRGERAHRGEHHGEHLGRAPGEHRVDRDDAPRHDAGARQQRREHLVGIAGGVREHRVDALRRRRHERQAVAPARAPRTARTSPPATRRAARTTRGRTRVAPPIVGPAAIVMPRMLGATTAARLSAGAEGRISWRGSGRRCASGRARGSGASDGSWRALRSTAEADDPRVADVDDVEDRGGALRVDGRERQPRTAGVLTSTSTDCSTGFTTCTAPMVSGWVTRRAAAAMRSAATTTTIAGPTQVRLRVGRTDIGA